MRLEDVPIDLRYEIADWVEDEECEARLADRDAERNRRLGLPERYPFSRTGGQALHEVACPHQGLPPYPLDRDEAMQYLRGSKSRHRCHFCSPEVPDVEWATPAPPPPRCAEKNGQSRCQLLPHGSGEHAVRMGTGVLRWGPETDALIASTAWAARVSSFARAPQVPHVVDLQDPSERAVGE